MYIFLLYNESRGENMKWFNKKEDIRIIEDIDISEQLNCHEAKLIHVNGTGQLKTSYYSKEDDYYGSINHVQLTLNDVPISYLHDPGCPTCASLIATGMGIENVDCEELKQVSHHINADFINLETSIQQMNPLLSLLNTGLYVIADMECYPTDGNKNFFWNVNNDYTFYESTSSVWLNDDDFEYEYVEGRPLYLYPTQTTKSYNKERVEEYKARFKSTKNPPRAIAYHCLESLNYLLDGHHKACASTLLNKSVSTIVIIPLSYISISNNKDRDTKYIFSTYTFNEKQIPKRYRTIMNSHLLNLPIKDQIHQVNHREWEDIYLKKARYYPTVKDIAMLDITGISRVSGDEINQWLSSLNKENRKKLRSLLAMWHTKKHPELKSLALKCANTKQKSLLKLEAFKVLNEIKGDIDIENLFIDYLIEDEDIHSPFKMIADSYWE